MLCIGGSQASNLEPKWWNPGVFWGALHLCHVGTMAGAALSTNRGYPCGHRSVATLVGWLELIWARGLWLTEAKQTKLVPRPCICQWFQGGVRRRDHVCQLLPPRQCSSSSLTIWWSSGGLVEFWWWLFYTLIALLNCVFPVPQRFRADAR